MYEAVLFLDVHILYNYLYYFTTRNMNGTQNAWQRKDWLTRSVTLPPPLSTKLAVGGYFPNGARNHEAMKLIRMQIFLYLTERFWTYIYFTFLIICNSRINRTLYNL